MNFNVPTFDFSPEFSKNIRTIGLCTILLISSIEIDINTVTKLGGIYLCLRFSTGIAKAIACVLSLISIFDVSLALALSLDSYWLPYYRN